MTRPKAPAAEPTPATITETSPSAVVDQPTVPEVPLEPAEPAEQCDVCGSPERVALPPGWQDAVNLMGAHIPVIGCGSPWHYLGMDA